MAGARTRRFSSLLPRSLGAFGQGEEPALGGAGAVARLPQQLAECYPVGPDAAAPASP
ncbi:hypothetical protein AB0H92_04785 [Streptomyces phaeochromogenes]|uniref:hypothetical protein n=1 Tax=Streptomyces phaeochromogenes TaxID=1923 RepID=UPI0033DA1837